MRYGRNKKRRVVITGLGPVSPVGIGKGAYWDSLVNGRSGITEITRFDASKFPTRIAGEVKGFKPEEFMSKKYLTTSGRFSQLAVAAARLAFEDSGIKYNGADPHRIGACMGSSAIGISIVEEPIPVFFEKGVRTIHPLTLVEYTAHIASSYVQIELAVKGPVTTISSGCSTAIDAVNWAYEQVRCGKADAIIAGASDAPLSPFSFGTFCAVRVLSKRNDEPEKASRPYDAGRDGMVLSEGGSAVVVEDLGHALERGARIYGEILGFASVSEAGQTVAVEMSGETVARVIGCALKSAHLNPTDINYICAHGNSMIDYDISETNGFKLALGDHAYRIPISSVKSNMGQSLAPASGLQLISSCLTLADGIIPPTINYESPDPKCDLDYVPNTARYNRVSTILMNAHSVGGSHSALIIGKMEE
jgi:3-oxoacyl-[acyl-carrier-protein] synthase II